MFPTSSGSHELFGPVLRAVELNMIILLFAQHYIAQVQTHVSTSVQPSGKQEPRFLKFHTVLSPLLPPSSSTKSYKTPSLWIFSLDICFFSLMTDYLHAH